MSAASLSADREEQNYFTFNGPNAPVGAGSLVPATEAQGDYMVKVSFLQRSFPVLLLMLRLQGNPQTTKARSQINGGTARSGR